MVLVTGGTGFLGAYTIKELVEKGYQVRAIRRNNKFPFFIPSQYFKNVEWVHGDVLDVVAINEAMTGIDTVIHSAAKVSFAPKERSEMLQTNIEGTANVVNTAVEKKIRRFVHVSSVAAIGRKQDGITVTEEQKWVDSKMNTNYAISKFHAEMEVWRGVAEGLNAVIVNPSTILGYGDWNTSSCRIFKTVYNELPWYTNGVNGFVDVEDAARAIVLLMESGINSERFILNSDNWTFRQLLDEIAKGFGKKVPGKLATNFFGSVAWRMEHLKSLLTGKPSLLTQESVRIAQTKTYFKNDKILQALPGFSFSPLQLTIQNACKKFLTNPLSIQVP